MGKNFWKRSFGFIALTAIAASVIAAPLAGTKLRASGEIIGLVEMGGNRVANAVVSLTDVSGSFAPPSSAVVLDQKDKEFTPHVLAVVKGTTVKFNNSDPFFHNVFSNSRIKMFNVSQEKKGDVSELTFEKTGLIPIRCHIHSNMKGYIVVLPNPYFAVTNEKGQFRIKDVPAGTYTVKVWSEHSSPATQSVEVSAGGRAKVIFKVSE